MSYRSGLIAALTSFVVACSGTSTPAPQPISGNTEPPPQPPGNAPSCEAVTDHLANLIPSLLEVDRATRIADCEQASFSDEFKRCVIEARHETDLGQCLAKYDLGQGDGTPDDRNEAERNLAAIEKGAKSAFFDESAFPVGAVPLSPPRSCCEYADAKCPPEPAVWQQPIWELVNFHIDEPHQYRYSYQSDGKTMRVIAEADLDCDGVVSTYVLDGATTGGDPFFQFTLTQPTHAE